jgi:hypothetical protein
MPLRFESFTEAEKIALLDGKFCGLYQGKMKGITRALLQDSPIYPLMNTAVRHEAASSFQSSANLGLAKLPTS